MPTAKGTIPASTLLFGGFFFLYAFLFCHSLSPYWFNSYWTTDDAMQQIYPFHKALQPELFKGDLITRMMECYLSPFHYWISYCITLITKDPILMGHWVMLLQVGGALIMVFLAVQRLSSTSAAFFAALWLLHSRHIIQRMTGGLPRGWAPLVIAAFLYLLVSKRRGYALLFLPIACLLHPPSALLLCVTFAFYVSWGVISSSTREEFLPLFKKSLLMAPIVLATALWISHMPPEIGTMASYEQASQMPEFQKPDGRFPFVPLRELSDQVRSFAFHVFTGRFYNPGKFLKRYIPEIVVGLCLLLIILGAIRNKEVLSREMWCYGAAAILVYSLSREFAFKLYLPDRHLQIPFGMFFIISLSAGLVRLCKEPNSIIVNRPEVKTFSGYCATALLVLLGVFVYAGSGSGLHGAMNFNTHPYKRGNVFEWVSTHIPTNAIIAGHPTFIDPVMLYGKRIGYVTTETSHPFYDRYYAEMKRRLEVAFKLHYATSLSEFTSLSRQEGITHVIFEKAAFTPERLAKERYFAPFSSLVKELTAQAPDGYVLTQFLKEPPGVDNPILYQDNYSILIDVARLP